MRFDYDKQSDKITDMYEEISIDTNTSIKDIWKFLNKQEEEKMEYKRQLKTLKYKIKQIVE